jgi:tRNA(adenine34) deaminase
MSKLETTPDQDEDARFMRRAIALAEKGDTRAGANAIGCVIVMDGTIIAEAFNEVQMRHDPSAHAEIMAMRRAGERLGSEEMRGATLYGTLQPCGMCSMAAIWAKLGRIVFGATRDQVHEMYFEDRHFDTMDFIRDAFRDDLSIEGGVLAEECAALYVGPDEDVPEAEQVNK